MRVALIHVGLKTSQIYVSTHAPWMCASNIDLTNHNFIAFPVILWWCITAVASNRGIHPEIEDRYLLHFFGIASHYPREETSFLWLWDPSWYPGRTALGTSIQGFSIEIQERPPLGTSAVAVGFIFKPKTGHLLELLQLVFSWLINGFNNHWTRSWDDPPSSPLYSLINPEGIRRALDSPNLKTEVMIPI